MIGGPPCQGFSSLNANLRGFQDPQSDGISLFVQLFKRCQKVAPWIKWDAMVEIVASMDSADRATVTQLLQPICDPTFQETGDGKMEPYWFDAVFWDQFADPDYIG